jgi:hypothetical protein
MQSPGILDEEDSVGRAVQDQQRASQPAELLLGQIEVSHRLQRLLRIVGPEQRLDLLDHPREAQRELNGADGPTVYAALGCPRAPSQRRFVPLWSSREEFDDGVGV